MIGKLVGAMCITAAALRLLWGQMSLRRQQLQLLQELAAALETMAAQIRWQRRPLPRILETLCTYPCAGIYFFKVQKELKCGLPLQNSWRNAFSDVPLAGDLLCTLELSGDEEKLTGALSYAAGQLRERWEQCCSQRRQVAKLWLAGVLSGAGVLIILLI